MNGEFNAETKITEQENAGKEAGKETTKKASTKSVKKNVYQKLMAIQTTIKAPKNLYNKFGNYNYRNAEGILEAVKPYLAEQECILVIEDVIEIKGEQITESTLDDGRPVKKAVPSTYLKAIAHFIDCESGKEITTSAYAKECDHKGMSADQCTGTASSYARKYCLNALFLLDDTKDSDSDEMKNIENNSKQNQNGSNVHQFANTNRTTQPAQNTTQPAQNTQKRTWGSR